MNNVLNILSDIKVIAAIAVLIVVLAVWLIVTKIRTKSLQKEFDEYAKRYDELKEVNLKFSMNKAHSIARIDAETDARVKQVQEEYEKYETEMESIKQNLADAEDDIRVGKLKKADQLLNTLDTQLTSIKEEAARLRDALDKILEKETSQRQEVNTYKNRFRALKSAATERSSSLSYSWDYIENRISSTEQMFSTFEEWMYSNDYEKANDELQQIKRALDEMESDVEVLPTLLQDARGVIPKMAEELHSDYTRERNRGVYLKHIEIEKNLSSLTVALKDDLKNLKAGKKEGVAEHLESYKQRITQLDEAVINEGKAFDQIDDLSVDTEKQFEAVEKSFQFVKDNFSKTSVRFGLEGMEKDIAKREEEFKNLSAEKPRVMENVKNRMIPSSTALVSLKELNEEISGVGESLKKMRSKIEVASGDEDRARKQLVKLQIIMNQIQVKIRKYKLPNISSQYEEDMNKASGYIKNLSDLMKETPLNIQAVNSNLQDSLDFIYKLYNDVNNVVGTVVMIENTIVFGNRYRSTYSDIDFELTRAELAFRNGEYTQALTMAIATIEKIHPGNYESMIKENAKGA